MFRFARQVALVIAGFAAFNQTVRATASVITSAFRAVEDFNASAIGTAALITSFSKAKDVDAFRQALVYSREAMEKLDLAAAKFVATGEDLRAVFFTFATKGVIPVSQRDFDALGRITDAILAISQETNKEIQLRQEVRALMEGQVRAGSQLAQIIDAQVDDLEDWVAQHRAAGDLLPAIAEKLAGFALAEDEIQKLASTWKNTLETIHSIVVRRAFAGTYEQITQSLVRLSRLFLDVEGNLTAVAETTIERLRPAFEAVGEAVSRFIDTIIKNWPTIVGAIQTGVRVAGVFIGVITDGIDLVLRFIRWVENAIERVEALRAKIPLIRIFGVTLIGPTGPGAGVPQGGGAPPGTIPAPQAPALPPAQQPWQDQADGAKAKKDSRSFVDFIKGLTIEARQAWENMAERWEAAAVSVRGSFASVEEAAKRFAQVVKNTLEEAAPLPAAVQAGVDAMTARWVAMGESVRGSFATAEEAAAAFGATSVRAQQAAAQEAIELVDAQLDVGLAITEMAIAARQAYLETLVPGSLEYLRVLKQILDLQGQLSTASSAAFANARTAWADWADEIIETSRTMEREAAKKFLQDMLQQIIGLGAEAGLAIVRLGQAIQGLAGGAWDALIERLQKGAEVIQNAFVEKFGALGPLIETAVFQIGDVVANFFGDIVSGAKTFAESVASFFEGIGNSILNLVQRLISNAAVAWLLSLLFPGGVGGIAGFSGFFRLLTGFAQGAVLRNAGLVTAQAGGVFSNPALALVAERPGMTELALPLPQGLRPQDLAEAIRGNGKGAAERISVYVVLDPKQIPPPSPGETIRTVIADLKSGGMLAREIRAAVR